jgi:hypothetical protein
MLNTQTSAQGTHLSSEHPSLLRDGGRPETTQTYPKVSLAPDPNYLCLKFFVSLLNYPAALNAPELIDKSSYPHTIDEAEH